jgi:ribonuclease HII
VVGPLVIAGVSIKEDCIVQLRELGVKDSKLLTPARRVALYPEILSMCDSVRIVKITPAEIDRVVRAAKKYKRLNYLEARYMAKVIDGLRAQEVMVDAADSVPARFQKNIADNLNRSCNVVARHFADRDFPVVSAASVIAKVERDAAVQTLRETYGDFGSGYPSDPKTRTFFLDWLRREEALPQGLVRKSWRTWDRLQQELLVPL